MLTLDQAMQAVERLSFAAQTSRAPDGKMHTTLNTMQVYELLHAACELTSFAAELQRRLAPEGK